MEQAAVHRMAKSIAQLTLCQVTSEEIETATKLLKKRATSPGASQKFRPSESLMLTMQRANCINLVAFWKVAPFASPFYLPFQPQKWASNKSNSSVIILRILRFLAESSGVTKLELFQPFPHCKQGFSRCTDSARLRQDSAAKDIKTGTKLW